jgi:NAD(P)H dehydrogenase (quinone)
VAPDGRILITGASGQVGAAVLRQLPEALRPRALAAARNPAKIPQGIETVLFDYSRPESMRAALLNVETIFMVTAYTVDMLDQSKRLIDEARILGVKHIVHLGAPGADDTTVAHYGWHQFVERYIEWSGLAYTHLRPEIFMQNLFGYEGVPVVTDGAIRYYVGAARQSWVDVEDIAAVAVAVLLEPARHEGQTYRLGYDVKTYPEIAEIFSAVLGKPFIYEALPPEAFLERAISLGGDASYMTCVYRSFVELTAGTARAADVLFNNFQELTGQQPRSMRDFVSSNANRFRREFAGTASI